MSLYKLSNFDPSVAIASPPSALPSIADICRSMLVVGYPSRKSAQTIGGLWRAALLDSMVQGYVSPNLKPTSYFDNLEQSERGAMSFLLSQAFTHLAATQCLGARYLVHVQALAKKPTWTIGIATNAAKAPGLTKSRPDFIGRTKSRGHIVFETKGRTGGITQALQAKALGQAAKISSINGKPPIALVASCFSFARKKQIKGVLVDPPAAAKAYDLKFSDAAAVCKAYSFFLEPTVSPLLRSKYRRFQTITLADGIEYGIESNVLKALRQLQQNLRQETSDEAVLEALDKNDEIRMNQRESGRSIGNDGIYVNLDRLTSRRPTKNTRARNND